MTAPNPNSSFSFVGYDTAPQFDSPIRGVRMHFVCLNPGPEQPNDYYILVSIDELTAITTQLQLRTLVQDRLNQQIRFTGIASKLDPFIGQTLTV